MGSLWMRMMILWKESTTLGCHKLFLSKNHTMNRKGKRSPIGDDVGLPISG